jgi:thiol-disulfide isomerase/thioredoxin
MTVDDIAPAERSGPTATPVSDTSHTAKLSWMVDQFIRHGGGLTMREILVVAAVTFLSVPVSWLTILSVNSQVKKTPTVSDSHSSTAVKPRVPIAEPLSHFVMPSDNSTDDPLSVLRVQTELASADLIEIRRILAAAEPRLIIVTRADASVERPVIVEVAKMCRANSMRCVQLNLVTESAGSANQVLPHADIHVDREPAPDRPDGVYLYDAAGHLRWHCSAAQIFGNTHELSIVAQTIVAEMLWDKEGGASSARAPLPSDAHRGISKSPTQPQPREAKGRLRLTTLDGEVANAVDASLGWTSLRNSWAVVDYPKKNGKHPTLLVFWATWCVPCVKEFPLIDELFEEYRSRVLFVGLADEQDSAVARERIAEVIKPFSFRLHYLLKNSSISRTVFNRADAPLPGFALFDDNGELVTTQAGSLADARNAEALRASLERIAKPKKKATD